MSDVVTTGAAPAVPEAIRPVIETMAGFPAPWALCGGWAVDAWLGRESREHGDIDVSVFIQDHREIYEHLRGWQLVAHHPGVAGDSNELWDGRRVELPAHLHGRLDRGKALPERMALLPEDGFTLDVQFDDRDGGDWVLSRDPLVTMPLTDAVATSRWGVPTVIPQALLFFKARDLRRRDHADFQALLPLLKPRQRAWLRDAVARLGHPWSRQLG